MKNKIINHIVLCALLTSVNTIITMDTDLVTFASPDSSSSTSQHNSPQLSPRNNNSTTNILKSSSSGSLPIDIPTKTINQQVSSYNAHSTSSSQSPSQILSPRFLPTASKSSDTLTKKLSLEKSLKMLKKDASSEEEKDLSNAIRSIKKFFMLSNTEHTYYKINKNGTLDKNRTLTSEDKRVNNHYKANLTLDNRAFVTATHLITTENGAQELSQEAQFSAWTTLTAEQIKAILQNDEAPMIFAFDNFGNSYHISDFEGIETENSSNQDSEKQNEDQPIAILFDNDDNEYQCSFFGSKIIINQILGENFFSTIYSEEMPEKRNIVNQLIEIAGNQCICLDQNNNFCMGTITEKITFSNPNANTITPTTSSTQEAPTTVTTSTTSTSQVQEITPKDRSRTSIESAQPESTPQTKKAFTPGNNKNRTTHKIIGTAILMAACLALLYKLDKLPTQLTDAVAHVLNSFISNRFYSFAR